MQFKLAQYCPVYLRIPCALSGTAWSSIWCFCNCWRTSRVPPSINNLSIRISLYLKKNLHDRIVIDDADIRSNTVSSRKQTSLQIHLYGAQVESFKPKNGRNSCDTVPLNQYWHCHDPTWPRQNFLGCHWDVNAVHIYIFSPGKWRCNLNGHI